MKQIKLPFRKPQLSEVPPLKEMLAPCPICGGTTDINWSGHIACHSCGQEWKLSGVPLPDAGGQEGLFFQF
jgi:hypothetical protein